MGIGREMDFLQNYWEQLSAFVILVVVLTRMRVDIDVLKDNKSFFGVFIMRVKSI